METLAQAATEIAALRVEERWFKRFAVSPDGTRAIASADGGDAHIWNLETGVKTVRLRGHEADIAGIAFSGDSRMAITGSDDGTARVWDVDSGRQITLMRRDKVTAVALSQHAFSAWDVAVQARNRFPDEDRFHLAPTSFCYLDRGFC